MRKLKDTLRNPKTARWRDRRAFANARQQDGETVDVFYARVRNLGRAIRAKQQDIEQQFLLGLAHGIQMTMQAIDDDAPFEVKLQKARDMEGYQFEDQPDTAVRPQSLSTNRFAGTAAEGLATGE